MHTEVGRWRATILVLVAWVPTGCNGAKSPLPRTTVDGPVGERADGSTFLVDTNFGGLTQSLRLARVDSGRLVDVFGLDGAGERLIMQREFVIAGGLVDELGRWELEPNPVTGSESLTIFRDVTDDVGRQEFFQLLAQSEANLMPVYDNGLGGAGLFSMVPRNATVLLTFDDLIDPQSITQETVRVLTGTPASEPFEARVIVDRNHGDLADFDGDGSLEFYPTRVIVDPTVSEFEAFGQDPPMIINGLGFPPSASINLSNVQLRIPTTPAPRFGQEQVLRNLSGHPLAVDANGTADLGGPTRDVVRAVRSGGPSSETADPFNGFLRDDTPPQLIGQQRVFIESAPVADPDDPLVFTVGVVRFDSVTCARAPRVGDVIQQPFVFAEVIEDGLFPSGGVANDVRVRLLGFPDKPGWPAAWAGTALGDATYSGLFDPLAGSPDPCFVRFSPPALDPDLPAQGLSPSVTATMRFSEVMDPVSITSFDTLSLTRSVQAKVSGDFVVGQIARSQDLRSFSFVTNSNLSHELGSSEDYYLQLSTGAGGPQDLAGNPLQAGPPPVRFDLDPDAATFRSGGRVTRFSNPDEDEPIGDDDMGLLPEWTGQHFYDLTRGLIRPRPVSRFQVPVDRSQPIISVMTGFGPGLQTPLSPFGCRMMHIYRYIDLGMNLRDTVNYNLDVEGLHWAPTNGLVTADNFPEYQLRLGHCSRAPDESTEGQTGCPRYPASGLTPPFMDQILTPEVSPMVVVHPRDRGYVVNPGDGFVTASATFVMPWPINRDPTQERITYTWRDTAIQGRGGRNNGGVDPYSVGLIGLDRDTMYSVDNVQTVGLPLLVEHRCYPAAAAAFGNNALDIVLAPPMFRRPTFRSFSVGGFSVGGNIVTVDPDLEERANGGFNPTNGGMPTPPTDPTIYLGAVDFVVRVSRSVSIWFEAVDPGGGFFDNPRYDQPLTDPPVAEQPPGTSIDLAFRGAISIVDAPSVGMDPRFNANTLDSYGNHYEDLEGTLDATLSNVPINFLGGDDSWHELLPSGAVNPTGIDGARYYQVRVSFVSNLDSGIAPALSALAVSWD